MANKTLVASHKAIEAAAGCGVSSGAVNNVGYWLVPWLHVKRQVKKNRFLANKPALFFKACVRFLQLAGFQLASPV